MPENTVRRGQDDDGTCQKMLSPTCVKALQERLINKAFYYTASWTAPPYSNLSAGVLPTVCSYLAGDISEATTKGTNGLAECVPYFDDANGNNPSTLNIVGKSVGVRRSSSKAPAVFPSRTADLH